MTATSTHRGVTMDLLDLRTIFLSHVATATMCTLVVGFLWRQNRRRYEGLSYWVGDFALQFVAALLHGLRGYIPDWMSMVLSNTFVLSGALLGYWGLERFVGQTSRRGYNVALLVAFVAVHCHFTLVRPDLTARSLNIAVVLGLISLQCVRLMLRRTAPSLRPTTRGVGLIFAAFVAVSLCHIPLLLARPLPTNDYFQSGLVEALIMLIYQLLLILLTFGLVLMVGDRLRLELRSQEEKYAKAFHSCPYAIGLSHLASGRYLEINDEFLRITGHQRAEVVGHTDLDLQLWVREEDRLAFVGDLLLGHPVRDRESAWRRKSGGIALTQSSGEVLSIQGEPFVLASIRDITELRRTEEATLQLESQNRQLQKSESLGRMAGAIAHHFNNELQCVMGNLELAMEDLPTDAGPLERLNDAMRSARAAAEVSSLMLTYLGQSSAQRKPMDLSTVCRDALSLLRAALPPRLRLEVSLPTPGPTVCANANQIHQVLTNLVTNAREASVDRGETIRIAVTSVRAADIPISHRFPVDAQLPEPNYACLEVADQGCGVPALRLDQLFDPFYSSKSSPSRGMGLPVALGIVRGHGGVITVETLPTAGTAFRVFLPVRPESAQ